MDSAQPPAEVSEMRQRRIWATGFASPLRRAFGRLPRGVVTGLLAFCLLAGFALVFAPKLLLVVVVAALVIGLTLFSPYAGLLIMVAFMFLRPAERFPALQAFHLARVQTLLLLAGWALERHLKGRKGLVRHPILTVFAAGAGVIALSSLTALWKQPAVSFLGNYLFALALFVVTIDLLSTERRLKGYVAVLMAAAAWSSVEQLRGYVSSGGAADVVFRAGAVGTFLQDSNDFGLALLFFLPFAYYAARAALRPGARWAAGALSVGLVWSIVATGSRGGAIGLMVLVFALWMQSRRKLLAGLGVVVFLAATWFLASPSYRERILSIRTYQQEETATVRRDAWKAGVRMFLQRPLLGVGPYNFQVGYGTPGYGTEEGGNWTAPHSLYVEALAELGIAGIGWLLALVVFIWLTARRVQRASQQAAAPMPFLPAMAHGVELSLIAYLAAGAFLSCLYYPYLWLLGGLAVALQRLTDGGVAPPAERQRASASPARD